MIDDGIQSSQLKSQLICSVIIGGSTIHLGFCTTSRWATYMEIICIACCCHHFIHTDVATHHGNKARGAAFFYKIQSYVISPCASYVFTIPLVSNHHGVRILS